jgi:hypothetical protein
LLFYVKWAMTFVLRQVSNDFCFTPNEQWLLFYLKWAMTFALRQVINDFCFTLSEQWLLFYAKWARKTKVIANLE